MAGVQADSHAGFVVYKRDGVAEIFESAAEDVATCCHILEQRDDSGSLLVSAIDVAGQVRDGFAFVAVRGVRHTWVEIVELDTEFLAAFEVVDEGIVGLCCACRVCVCQIDQVGPVWDDMFVLVIRMVLAIGVEAIGGFGQ
jgi:hypothetical protein